MDVIDKVKKARDERDVADYQLRVASRRYADTIRIAVDKGGWSFRRLAREIGISPARAHQIYHS